MFRSALYFFNIGYFLSHLATKVINCSCPNKISLFSKVKTSLSSLDGIKTIRVQKHNGFCAINREAVMLRGCLNLHNLYTAIIKLQFCNIKTMIRQSNQHSVTIKLSNFANQRACCIVQFHRTDIYIGC